jgi:hypothetical protein
MSGHSSRAIRSWQDPRFAIRFWRKVAKSDECWIWTASVDGSGYGQINVGGMNWRAHRMAWTLLRGLIPDGTCVLHNCPGGDNPRCVNPDHLFLGSMRDNTQDMLHKGRDGHGQSPGQKNPNCKLTDEDIRNIRSMRSSGCTLRQIALQFGITEANVSIIALRKGWKHVV